MAFDTDFSFDSLTYRHHLNGFEVVMHCHHYMTLLTKLAADFDEFDGLRILVESAEDTVRPLFDDYIEKKDLSSPEEKLEMAKGFYEVMGMGLMESGGDEQGGEVTLTRSHVDQGWISKLGQHDQAVNYWTCGFISAMFAAAFDKPARSYKVVEEASIVKGDEASRFSVKAR